jgi:gentisate 1,2-dioxygenase
MNALGTLDELPAAYRAALGRQSLSPLWPQMRNLLPAQWPVGRTRPCLWSYAAARPLLLEAGRLTPVEKAERRVLVLSDPGRGADAMQLSSAIYCGLQLLLPGEHAPPHRHTPSAARIVVEGRGAVTIVDGERCTMEPGDVILTPGGMWHDHVHEGSEPVIWLDALDLPLLVYLEGSYAQEPPGPGEAIDFGPKPEALRARYPTLRFAWSEMHAKLVARDLDVAEIEYANPLDGGSVLLALGFTAMRLRASAAAAPPRRSCTTVFHVVTGSGESMVNGEVFRWARGDTFSAPAFATLTHSVSSDSDAYLIAIHDRPLQEKLGFYEERPG